MHKNPVWLGLLGFIFSIVLWFSIIAFYHLYDYYSLEGITKPTDISWFVEEISSEDFRVGATYSYTVNDTHQTGETIFHDRRFRNPSSADDELKIKSTKEMVVFYNPQNISHSSLEKKFPFKESATATVLFLLFLYLFGLGIYTSKKPMM